MSENKQKTTQRELLQPINIIKKKPKKKEVIIAADIVFTKKKLDIYQIEFKVIGTPTPISTQVEGYCLSDYIGHIIGRRGSNIKKLRSIASVYIKINPEIEIFNSQSYRKCYIRGSSVNVQKCICELFKLINETDDISKIKLPQHEIFRTHSYIELKKDKSTKSTKSTKSNKSNLVDSEVFRNEVCHDTSSNSFYNTLNPTMDSVVTQTNPHLDDYTNSNVSIGLHTHFLTEPMPQTQLVPPVPPTQLEPRGQATLLEPQGLLMPQVLLTEPPTIKSESIDCEAFIFKCTNSNINIFQEHLIFALDQSCTHMMKQIGSYSNILLYNTDTCNLHGLYKKVSEVNTLTLYGCYSNLQAQILVEVYGNHCEPIHLPFISSWKKGPLNQKQYQLLMHLISNVELFKDVRQIVI